MNIKKEIIYHNSPIFQKLRDVIKEKNTKNYSSHIKEILWKNRESRISYHYRLDEDILAVKEKKAYLVFLLKKNNSKKHL